MALEGDLSYAAGLRLNKKDSSGDPIDAQAAEVKCQVGGGGGLPRFFILALLAGHSKAIVHGDFHFVPFLLIID